MRLFRRVSLKRKPEKPAKCSESSYPSLYISDKNLSLKPEDVGKTFKANVELKLTNIGVSHSSEMSVDSYSFDIKSIELEK